MCPLNPKYLLFILISFLLFKSHNNLYSCTIFYLVRDSLILAGNNEDWKDPAPIMWFYPAEEGRHGWVKFGWGSGFPQGGINDQGLFWDATAGPYLAMPRSEATKEKYNGPLMQKVIEECSNVEEALALFSAYYCDDLYRAQYLIGDASQHAIIVEGDSILQMLDDHMILTNFYHSHPELGGYPCSRYEKASQMIDTGGDPSPYMIGAILEATHQEGMYPTQYSQIYNLKSRIFYLFYYHNFEEFILIDLNKELKRGPRYYSIPELFAGIKPIAPETGASLTISTQEFCWNGKPGYYYELCYSTQPDFPEGNTTTISCLKVSGEETHSYVYGMAGFILLLILAGRTRKMTQMGLLIIMTITLTSCNKEQNPEKEDPVLMTRTVSDLQPGTTYYWKIRAHPIHSDDFWSESITRIIN